MAFANMRRAAIIAVTILPMACGGSPASPGDSPSPAPESIEPPEQAPPPSTPPELQDALEKFRNLPPELTVSPGATSSEPKPPTPPVPNTPGPAAPPPMPGATELAKWGEFNGRVVAEWLDDNRRMRLVQDFQYVDPAGITWDAPAGIDVDGASIPRVFWTFIGGPFEGRYRNASVVHDWACDPKNRMNTWRKVHQMFYNATRRGGVSELSAKIMYGAVYHYGPRWDNPPARTLRDDADFLRMREYIRRNSTISLDAIEALTGDFLREQVAEVPPATLQPLF